MADLDSVTAAQTGSAAPSTHATTKQAPTAADQASLKVEGRCRAQVTEMSEWLETNSLSLPAQDLSLPAKYRGLRPTTSSALQLSEDWTACTEGNTKHNGRIFHKLDKKWSNGLLDTRYFQHAHFAVRLRAEYVDGKLIEHEWRLPKGGSILMRQSKAFTDRSLIEVETSDRGQGKVSQWLNDNDIQAALPGMLRALKQGIDEDD